MGRECCQDVAPLTLAAFRSSFCDNLSGSHSLRTKLTAYTRLLHPIQRPGVVTRLLNIIQEKEFQILGKTLILRSGTVLCHCSQNLKVVFLEE